MLKENILNILELYKIKLEIKDWIRPIVYEKKSIEISSNSIPFNLSQLTPQEVSLGLDAFL